MSDFRDVLARQLVEAASTSRGRRAARAARTWVPAGAAAALLATAVAAALLAWSAAQRPEPVAVAPVAVARATPAGTYALDVTTPRHPEKQFAGPAAGDGQLWDARPIEGGTVAERLDPRTGTVTPPGWPICRSACAPRPSAAAPSGSTTATGRCCA